MSGIFRFLHTMQLYFELKKETEKTAAESYHTPYISSRDVSNVNQLQLFSRLFHLKKGE